MNCRTARRRLATCRPDDQLPAELAAHLGQCGRCRSAFENDRAVWGLLEQYTAPPSNAPRLEVVLLRHRTRKGHWLVPPGLVPTRGFAAATAAVLIFGTLGGLWCGRTLVDLGDSLVPPDVSAASAVDDASIFTATPPGSLTAAYLADSEPTAAVR
jgi:anti-sigma factor RsiW